MIQIANLTEMGVAQIPMLLNKINPVLNKRKVLFNERYKRLANTYTMFSLDDEKIKVALETYIGDMTTGYFGGKEPMYEVTETLDEDKRSIIKKMFSRVFSNKNYEKEMEVLMKYITDFNDDGTEHLMLVKDYFLKTAAYEIMYENEDNELVYTVLDALQTVAIYDYSTPQNLIGLVRTWEELDDKEKSVTIVEITDINGTRTYKQNGKGYDEVGFKNNNWNDVPAIAMEQPEGLAIFESVISLIDAYQRVVQNSRNTFQYNDDAKLKVTGYQPEHSLTTTDDNGTVISNPDREAEDEFMLESKVFYTPDASGDIEWIEKTVQDGALTNHKKTLMDLISMISGVPNMSDLGFTNADNASAIDRKFFNLEQKITIADKLFKKGYLRRWKLIFDRINLKMNTKYDYRDIRVMLNRNLPTDKYTETDSALKLRGLISDESVINMLPYELDANNELMRMNKKEEEGIEENIENELPKEVVVDEREMAVSRQEVR
jgi:SPP1 family phage portal protein